jgi:predicted DNA binding CopG/RHH family protein
MKKQIKARSAMAVCAEDDPLAGDLTGYLSTLNWSKTPFVLAPNDTTVTIRVPKGLVAAVKKAAAKRGVKYHRWMRDAILKEVLKVA